MERWQVDDSYVKETCLRRWRLDIKKTGVRHWNGPCPNCGGKDRFYVTEHGRCVCNQCDFRAWLDDDQKWRPDPLLLQHRAEEEAREKAEHEQRWKDWSNGFLAGFYWRQWHDTMSAENREWYHKRGIGDPEIDLYELGYIKEKEIETPNGKLVLAAYSIPIRDVDTWEIVNMHYRLENPPVGIGKYRYEHGIPSREFYAVPGLLGKAIVVEGAFKSIVVNKFMRQFREYQVVGLPGCTPGPGVIERMKKFDEIYLALDPGCAKQAHAFKLAVPQTKIVSLSDKPDDAFLGGLTSHQFVQYMEMAR